MAKYYYNRYTAVYSWSSQTSTRIPWQTGTNKNLYASEPTWDGSKYVAVGTSAWTWEPGWTFSNKTTVCTKSYYYRDRDAGQWGGTEYTRTRSSSKVRGSLVQSNIIAENGTYPVNGISGSYWYVRGSIVTPGTPTSITVPAEIKGGTTISISWGTSSNSDSFRLERQLNGGSWTQVYNGTNRSYSDTVPKGTLTVAYRVRGANGTAYSSYRTSSTVTVKNFPEMGIRVSGALKTSDAGWVRVGGQLREIDTMWVRINGAIKEVQ